MLHPCILCSNLTMFAEKAFMLIKEIDRNRDSIPPYNGDLVNEVQNEIKKLVIQNCQDAQLSTSSIDGGNNYIPTIKIRHCMIKRNMRCLSAYHYHRMNCLKKMRWQFGTTLPTEIKANLTTQETNWFSNYSNNLVQYMRSIGENGLNLALDLKPPQLLHIQVRCLLDFGQFELNDGSLVFFKKNSRHYLPRSECEELIRQGVLEHVF